MQPKATPEQMNFLPFGGGLDIPPFISFISFWDNADPRFLYFVIIWYEAFVILKSSKNFNGYYFAYQQLFPVHVFTVHRSPTVQVTPHVGPGSTSEQ
jgi:hypothetical protein